MNADGGLGGDDDRSTAVPALRCGPAGAECVPSLHLAGGAGPAYFDPGFHGLLSPSVVRGSSAAGTTRGGAMLQVKTPVWWRTRGMSRPVCPCGAISNGVLFGDSLTATAGRRRPCHRPFPV